jgi:hypothetical protein
MNPDHPTPEQVEAILVGAVAKHPTDSELLPVLNFLLPIVDVPLSTSASSSSSSSTYIFTVLVRLPAGWDG